MELSDKRTKQIIFRVSNTEYQQILLLKTRARLATWVREKCLTDDYSIKKVDHNLLVALARIGGNLNQITKYINYHKKDANCIENIKILTELALIRSDLDSLLEFYTNSDSKTDVS